MRRPIILPVILLLNAVGITAFWVNWFAQGNHLNAMPVGYRLFENTFPLPDGILAVLMVALAALLWRRSPHAPLMAMVVSGMLLYLFGLDTQYHWMHGAFSTEGKEHDYWGAVIISVDTLALGIVLLVWALRQPSSRQALQPSYSADRIAAIFALCAVIQVAWWSLFAIRPTEELQYWPMFLSMFQLADLISALLAASAAALLWNDHGNGKLLGIHVCSGWFFGMLNLLGYMVMNPEFTHVSLGMGATLCLAVIAAITWLATSLLRLQPRS